MKQRALNTRGGGCLKKIIVSHSKMALAGYLIVAKLLHRGSDTNAVMGGPPKELCIKRNN